MKKVVAMIGSLSSNSANQKIVDRVAELSSGRLHVEIYDGIRGLPQFNPDFEGLGPLPETVNDLRRTIREADGVLISTPEYVFGVPGSLKNAIDWTVASADFRLKRVGLIVASTSGEKAFESLLLTFKTLEAEIDAGCSLLISHVKAKLAADGNIKHEQTAADLTNFVDSFVRSVEA